MEGWEAEYQHWLRAMTEMRMRVKKEKAESGEIERQMYGGKRQRPYQEDDVEDSVEKRMKMAENEKDEKEGHARPGNASAAAPSLRAANICLALLMVVADLNSGYARRHKARGAVEATTKYLVPSTLYQVPGTKYLVPSPLYQVPGTKYLVPSTWYQDLVPSTCGTK